jgi:DNA-directed RNA polymerase subunit beta
MVRILVVTKHQIRVGDKLTGRHGNKGIVSKIIPSHKMPYISDGTSLDAILSPFGIISRMNLGQLKELNLGWHSFMLRNIVLNNEISTSCQLKSEKIKSFLNQYNNFTENQKTINELLINHSLYKQKNIYFQRDSFEEKNKNEKNSFQLLLNKNENRIKAYDGITGYPYHRLVTTGYLYMFKLNHLVDEKIHARTIGPEHLITKQPLGGKSRQGGQRFGEMEVWGIQSYGASFLLHEMSTIKSSSSNSKKRHLDRYRYVLLSNYTQFSGAFGILMKELWGLCLNIRGF